MPDPHSQGARSPLAPVTMSELADIVSPPPSQLPSPSQGGDARVIDIRDPDAFEAGHIPGSSRIGIAEIDLPYLLPPRRRGLLVVAEDPAQAVLAASRLRSIGYEARPLLYPLSAWMGEWETGREREPAWEPSPLVMEWGRRLDGLRDAVDLGCGSGRDAVHLAMRGMRVTGIDLLPDAIAQGRHLAERHGVSVSFVCADVRRDPGCWAGPWGLINVQRFLDRPSLPLLGRRLREGGFVLYEAFLETQAEHGRRPRRHGALLRSGELRESAIAQGLKILHYREGRDRDGDWTASLVGRRDRAWGGPQEPAEGKGGNPI